MQFNSRWPETVSGTLPFQRLGEEPLLLALHELHWIAVSVRNQAASEERVLRFLEQTRAWADDPDWHEQQVQSQQHILAGYRALARKLDRLDPEEGYRS